MPEIDKDVVYFARTNFRNNERLFGIKRKDRRQHMYVIGKTGTGKSALLNNLITQDIANGEGLCVIDPHGELAEGILEKIPKERMDDVIYFNPADAEFHIGFNVLELPDPKYKHLAASGLMSIFTKIWSGVWSARMEYILNNAILALLDTPGSTLLGITRLLVDKEFRQKIVGNIKDPVVKAFWVNEYEEWKDQFRNEAIAPIQNKVGQFLSTSMVRNIVGQSKSTIDIFDIMNTGKIFIVNVSKGRIGEDNSALLGAMLITKIQLAAMERVRVPEDERVDFYLYVDEFQNFATDSFASILSESRKYRLDLILAHQYIGQLVTDVSTKVRDAVFGNVGTMIAFRIGAADAEFLESEFEPEFVPQDFVNLPNYTVYLKLMVDGVTSRPFSAKTLPPFKVESSSEIVKRIIDNSRKRYTRPAWEVEKEVSDWSGMGGPGGSAGAGRYEVICSSCGKTTTVPFEPQPGRPVYCQDCLAKIKAGELQPVTVRRDSPAVASTQNKQFSDLAKLGIEYEEKAMPIGRQAASTSPAGQAGSRPPMTPPRTERKLEEARKEPSVFKKAFSNFKPQFKPQQHQPQSQPQPQSQHRPQSQERTYPNQPAKPTAFEEKPFIEKKNEPSLHLSDLAKTHEEKRTKEPKEGMDVESLRDALKDALNKIE